LNKKKEIPMKIFTTFFCAALALSSAVYAQTPADHLTVHFSTPVLVGETRFPAGDCDIQVTRGSSDAFLVIREKNGPSVVALASHLSENDSEAEGAPSAVFTRHGDDLQLSRILFGDHTGFQLNNAQ
jgi:hypothetical protein